MTRTGFTLIEVLVATALVGSAMIAGVYASTNATRSVRISHERAVGQMLVNDLASEIITLEFEDPDGSPRFGPEPGETRRSDYDDIDDYDGFAEANPTDWMGDPIPAADGWKRVVSVSMATSDGRTTSNSTNTGIKRVSIMALAPSGARFTLYFLRSRGGLGDLRPPVDQTHALTLRADWSNGPTGIRSSTTPLLNTPEQP